MKIERYKFEILWKDLNPKVGKLLLKGIQGFKHLKKGLTSSWTISCENFSRNFFLPSILHLLYITNFVKLCDLTQIILVYSYTPNFLLNSIKLRNPNLQSRTSTRNFQIFLSSPTNKKVIQIKIVSFPAGRVFSKDKVFRAECQNPPLKKLFLLILIQKNN